MNTSIAAATAAELHTEMTSLVHGAGSPMTELLRTCQRIASSNATVLVTGETGTGKEVVARLLHQQSHRAAQAFVPVNCGAIPEALLESELFGHVRGAFTGAVNARRGRVSMAQGGTLFLDEIGELPLNLQVKLLRLLQERTYEPVGSADSVRADFRLVAATNRNLAAEVEAGRFRQDLYYRLMVCPLELPALRERPMDVAPLFKHFWAELGEKRPVEAVVFEAMAAYSWPGNVRELENLVERVSVCTEGPLVHLHDLPVAFRGPSSPSLHVVARRTTLEEMPAVVINAAPPSPTLPQGFIAPASPPPAPVAFIPPAVLAAEAAESLALSTLLPPRPTLELPVDLPGILRQVEEAYIDAALIRADGNKKAAAEMLGLQRTTLVEKLRRRNRDGSAVSLPE